MISEILGGDFMDYRKVHEICAGRGITKHEVKTRKKMEGIGTLRVENQDGETLWLWFDPQQIWEKYHG